MRSWTIWRNVALMILFAALGLGRFSENVRAVQVVGLMASGAVVGVSLVMLIQAWRAGRKRDPSVHDMTDTPSAK